MTTGSAADPVPAVTEADAPAAVAAIFADIRKTLRVDVVNLVWRHLATMPCALEWVWQTIKPLYLGPAIERADALHNGLKLPRISPFSADTLASAGIDQDSLISVHAILDSYHHTNALALMFFSAFLVRFEGQQRFSDIALTAETDSRRAIAAFPASPRLPKLPSSAEMTAPVGRLVFELNSFGEDSDPALIASMYRHLSYWPSYLAMIRTLLVPLHESGQLIALVAAARHQGELQGRELAASLPNLTPPVDTKPALHAIRRFVDHPIARMTGICALIREATPRI
jgi:hypothetical protein